MRLLFMVAAIDQQCNVSDVSLKSMRGSGDLKVHGGGVGGPPNVRPQFCTYGPKTFVISLYLTKTKILLLKSNPKSSMQRAIRWHLFC